ncbi:MAG: iron hydrogenase small subunit [Spirochaetales bacterium]|nr:iron hydrogenase small subunit [Spirochaetales bacterium]
MKPELELTIDGLSVRVPRGTTVLEAARRLNVNIPTLCYHEDLSVAGNCRMCLVEVEGHHNLEASCALPATEGMNVRTMSGRVFQARQDISAMLVSEHGGMCTTCYRNTNCELQNLSASFNIDHEKYIPLPQVIADFMDTSSLAIERDMSKCVRCQRCVRTCAELQHVNAIGVVSRGKNMRISTFFDRPIAEVNCVLCGQCVTHCPTGALTEHRYYHNIWNALNDPEKTVIVTTAPSVRAGLGEMFGLPIGEPVTGRMVTALRRLGFDAVLDTDFAADLTIMEEGAELLGRLRRALEKKEPVVLPMLTSCSPGWVKYIEHNYHGCLPHLSSAKSPQQMFGAVVKTWYAKKMNIDPAKMVCVAIMPCSAKKFEANRPEMRASGFQDVDFGLTTRELGRMIKMSGMDFAHLEDSDFDKLMGASSGAGVIFGATGGVMEAALRTVYEITTGRPLPFDNLEMHPIRGLLGIKDASLTFENVKPEYAFLEGVKLNVAVAHGLTNAHTIMEDIASGQSPYHFVEIMACPGGCVGGGGAPIPTSEAKRKARAEALYKEDRGKARRKSHENPEIIALYDDFLGEPLSEVCHHLLHTTYTPRRG